MEKKVSDIGIAAYLMMHGYKVVGREGKIIYFNIKDDEEQEFDTLSFEYLSSQFHHFDNNIMALKKMGERKPRY